MPSLPPDNRSEGFTAIPRRLLDAALCSDMGKRELRLWLLVARLTYGTQGREWIALRPSDLIAIGIGPNHARACLHNMCAQGLLLQNDLRDEYRLNTAIGEPTESTLVRVRQERLSRLVARQLGNGRPSDTPPPRFGKLSPPQRPTMGNELFPPGERSDSQNGNASTGPAWVFSRSHRRFVKKDNAPIDSLKTSKDKSKISNHTSSAYTKEQP